MKLPRHIALYAGLLLVAGAYKLVELSHPAIPFLHAYLEDILAIPIILKTALIVVQKSFKPWRTRILRTSEIIALTVVFSIYFEAILPNFNPKFTSDVVDVLCYTIGAYVFYKWLNVPLIHELN